MKKQLIIVTGTATLLVFGAVYVSWIGTAYATFERPAYEGLDTMRLYKAYRKMHIDIATGKLTIPDDFDENNEDHMAMMDKELLHRYHSYK